MLGSNHLLQQTKQKKTESESKDALRKMHSIWSNKNRAFYFRALGSLVVLSFPQLLSFSSVFPKPLSETLTRSSDGRNPVQLTVLCWRVGPRLVGPRRVGLVKRDRVGQDETVFGHTSGAGGVAYGAVACGAVWVRDVGTSGFCLFRPD
jgi:hypothetical protein